MKRGTKVGLVELGQEQYGAHPMKTFLSCTALALALTIIIAPADAKGCLKGAAVGGVAGHVAGHHGVIGAAAGCVIGHHEASKKTQQNDGQ